MILVIEDDHELSRLISTFLHENGFEVEVVADGHNAVEKILEIKPKLVVLDIMLPGKDGLTICKEVRHLYSGNIVLLTALNDEIDEVAGLEIGADAYLTKPIRPRVLLAHIRALLRRSTFIDSSSSQQSEDKIIKQGLEICQSSRTVMKDNENLDLSDAEYNLLWYLAQNAGNIIHRDQIYKDILNLEYDGLDRSIDVRVSRIRKKIEQNPQSPQIIKSVRGVGYLFVDNS